MERTRNELGNGAASASGVPGASSHTMYAELGECARSLSVTNAGACLLYPRLPVSQLRGHERYLGVYSNVGQFSSDHRHREFDAERQPNQWSSDFELWHLCVRDAGHDYGEYPGYFPDTPNRPVSKSSV